MGGDPRKLAPYEEAAALYDYQVAYSSWVTGKAALQGLTDLRVLPATTWLAVVYCLLLEDSEEALKRRTAVDEMLAGLNAPARDTWGRMPSQQAAMARAATLAGGG